jgi:hypothetical protein
MADDLLQTWALPVLVVDGVSYQGTGHPRMRDGLQFIRAIEAKASVVDQLEGAKAVLLACGFDADLIDGMEMPDAIEAATGFFLAALQPRNGAQPS